MKFNIAVSVRTHGGRSGMSADVQASRHDSTAHAQRLFPPKMGGRQL